MSKLELSSLSPNYVSPMKSYDVLVCGGGFAGLGAAFTLSEKGWRVLLVEPRPSVGWEAGWSFNLELAGGISRYADILRDRLGRSGGLCNDRMDPVIAELHLLKMAEGRFDILHYCHPVGVFVKDGRATGISLAGKSGVFHVAGRCFIDATGDFLLRRCAGESVPDEKGGTCVFSFFMNGVEGTGKLPTRVEYAGSRIHIKRTPWAKELAIEYESASADIYSGRLVIPELLSFLKAEIPPLKDALMSHAAIAGLRVPSGRCNMDFASTKAENLFATASALNHDYSGEDRGRLLARLMESGEKAAHALLDRSGALDKTESDPAEGAALLSLPAATARKDVVVCGGGASGAIAAIASAREGGKTLLLESSPCLGGIGTGGTIHLYYHGVPGGLQDEVDGLVQEMTPLFVGRQATVGFHPEIKKIVLQRMAVDAGVEIRFENTVYAAKARGVTGKAAAPRSSENRSRLESVSCAGAAGIVECGGSVFVDCTGDGDVAALAGARSTFGRTTDFATHPFSQSSCILWKTEEGGLTLSHHNYDAGYCDPTDPDELSRARVEGLLQYWKERFDEGSRLLYFAHLLGLRNSRQIIGDYVLTLSDEIAGREFDDVIAYSYSHYDNHSSDYENESLDAMFWCWGLGMFAALIGCEVPYRALLPAGIDNLLVACRALSMDFDAHNQLRMMRDLQRTGEAAGIAAALSTKKKVTPRDLDVKLLQEKLVVTGALKRVGDGYHHDGWKPEGLYSLSLKVKLDAQKSYTLKDILRIMHPPEKLLLSLNSADSKERAIAALFLAFMGDAAGLPVLVKCVEERLNVRMVPEDCWWAYKAAPQWKTAVALLGEMKCREALPAIENILEDPKADQAALVLAVKALGKIGDRKSANRIVKMLARTDLPSKYCMMGGKVEIDASWRLELAAVENLAMLGVKRKDIADKYLNHPSACVRRYARKVSQVP